MRHKLGVKHHRSRHLRRWMTSEGQLSASEAAATDQWSSSILAWPAGDEPQANKLMENSSFYRFPLF